VREGFLLIHRLYGAMLWAFAMLAGALTLAIMCVIVVNAVLRKLVNWPLPAALEITQSLLVGAIVLPFAFALLTRQHVNTVVFTSRLSAETNRRLHLLWALIGFLLFAAVTYGTFQYAMRSYRMNEQTWGAAIQFAIWPSKMGVSLGTLLLSLQFLLDAIGYAFVPRFHDLSARHAEARGGV
jgi:TRAP-type C4-dicarboxylate transport system permease small subunit